MDNQNKPLKRYPRRSEPAASELSLDVINKLGSSNGTLEETAAISRLFCRESFLSIFNIVVSIIYNASLLVFLFSGWIGSQRSQLFILLSF